MVSRTRGDTESKARNGKRKREDPADRSRKRNAHIATLAHELSPLVCVGELLAERKEGRHFEVVKTQTLAAFEGLSDEQVVQIVVAYEPVWAIGTGETASPEQAQEMHAFIRSILAEQFGDVAQAIRLLYGGSMKPANAQELLSRADVDGGLIGGASLNAEEFISIIKA